MTSVSWAPSAHAPDRRPGAAGHLQTMSVALLDSVCAIEVTAYPYPWSRGNFIDSMSAGYHCACLVDAQQALLGYMVAMDGVDEVHLLNITVAPALQGRGHARLMLDALTRRARALALGCIWLEVRPSNLRARALYRRYGFEDIGVRRGYYPDADGRREDALVMRLQVPPTEPTGATDAVD